MEETRQLRPEPRSISSFWPDFLLLAVIWLPILEILSLEWRYNEQYYFGFFVPIFTIYLIYNRLNENFRTSTFRLPYPILWFCLVLFIPLQIIETANPDWRLIYYLITILGCIVTLLVLVKQGGVPFALYLTPPLMMILFAVAWPINLETRVTLELMQVVATITVEILNLLGIYAVQRGSVIELSGALIGIEEACSGVRSLQSSLMAGYLFGELFRMSIVRRALLIAISIAFTFLLNIIRTLTLTFITYFQGESVFEDWHDPIGNAVSIVGFIGVWLLAFWIRKKATEEPAETETEAKAEALKSLGIMPAMVGIIIAALSLGVDWLWYARGSSKDANLNEYAFNKAPIVEIDAFENEIDPLIKAQLKYTEGYHYIWVEDARYLWSLFYFKWEAGNISSHAGVHRPENCLPSAGFRLIEEHEPIAYPLPNGQTISIRRLSFALSDQRLHVFFTVWNDHVENARLSETAWERIEDAWAGRIVDGRHSLQWILSGYPTIHEAQAAVLDNLVAISSTSANPDSSE